MTRRRPYRTCRSCGDRKTHAANSICIVCRCEPLPEIQAGPHGIRIGSYLLTHQQAIHLADQIIDTIERTTTP